MTAPKVKLNNGFEMPTLGMGTYLVRIIITNSLNLTIISQLHDFELIKFGLLNGYRLIDTAYFYKNESVVGKAVNDGKLNT